MTFQKGAPISKHFVTQIFGNRTKRHVNVLRRGGLVLQHFVKNWPKYLLCQLETMLTIASFVELVDAVDLVFRGVKINKQSLTLLFKDCW
jgi:hypothetical protein